MSPQRDGVADHGEETYPVEPKVKAATVGGGAAGVITAFIVWLLDQMVYNGEDVPPDVPFPAVSMVGLAVGAALPFVAGYYARHVNR